MEALHHLNIRRMNTWGVVRKIRGEKPPSLVARRMSGVASSGQAHVVQALPSWFLVAFQVLPCSRSSAPTMHSSTSSSSTLSPSLASSSLPFCWCVSKAGTPARTQRGRMGCPCCGSRSRTSTILQLAWSPLCSASILEP